MRVITKKINNNNNNNNNLYCLKKYKDNLQTSPCEA